MTATVLETDNLEQTWDEDFKCCVTHYNVPCPNTVTWLLIFVCPATSTRYQNPFCDPCRARWIQILREGNSVFCLCCNTPVEEIIWEKV